jgi:pyruvyl transferase EpsI
MKLSLFGIVHNSLLETQLARTRLKLKQARQQNKQVVIMVGTPIHRNIGDLAIARAQSDFVKKYTNAVSINLPMPIVMQYKSDILNQIVRPGDILAGYGGGNMGDMYMIEELCRRKFIQDFPENKILIFPQTIHFSDTKSGQEELLKTQEIYSKHKGLTLIAREQHSYDVMKKVFNNNAVLFTPDIVLSMNASAKRRSRNGLLICLRNDMEAKIDDADKQLIAEFAKQHFNEVRYTDTISSERLFRYRSKNGVVERKLDEFRGAKLVITDRLHGMVFSAITGTPCIAMASFNHKVTNSYKWLEHLPYIKFCNNIAELESLVAPIDLDKTYDYDPSYFDEYWNKIRDVIVAHG